MSRAAFKYIVNSPMLAGPVSASHGLLTAPYCSRLRRRVHPQKGARRLITSSQDVSAHPAGAKEVERTWLQSLGQSLNFAGVRLFLHVRGGHEELALPHVSVPDIRHIDWSAIRAAGFQGIAFDKDGTLTLPYSSSLHADLQQSLDACSAAFGGKVVLFSNSAGLFQFDPEGEVAARVERELGIPVLRHSEKKPAGSAAELEALFGCPADRLVMVGDRYLTDVVYGNKNGMLTVHCSALSTDGEPTAVRMARRLENYYISSWRSRGIAPPPHKLVPSEEVLATLTIPVLRQAEPGAT